MNRLLNLYGLYGLTRRVAVLQPQRIGQNIGLRVKGNAYKRNISARAEAEETGKGESEGKKGDEGTSQGEGGEKVPDISSTSLGLEDPVDDPLKWQKFAWKYAGALLLFAICYNGLHWYVGKLEEEAKEKRKKAEIGRASDPGGEGVSPGGAVEVVGNAVDLQNTGGNGLASVPSGLSETPSQYSFSPSVEAVREVTLTPLEELELRELELSARLKEMRAQGATEVDESELREIEKELEKVEQETAKERGII